MLAPSRGISSSVERKLPKLERRVRFPYPALMSDFADALRQPAGDLYVELLDGRAAWERAVAAGSDRRLFEELLQEAYGEADEWYLPAICQACGIGVALMADRRYSVQGVNFR